MQICSAIAFLAFLTGAEDWSLLFAISAFFLWVACCLDLLFYVGKCQMVQWSNVKLQALFKDSLSSYQVDHLATNYETGEES